MSLEDFSTLLMFFSTLVVVACLVAVFSLEGQLPVGVLVAGHALAMVGAVGIKIGYVMRLEALARRQSEQG
ncbi:MAG: hypothetical protein R3F47_15150 [Gammaproteobacteria bacterium]|jgi:hypothetical protein